MSSIYWPDTVTIHPQPLLTRVTILTLSLQLEQLVEPRLPGGGGRHGPVWPHPALLLHLGQGQPRQQQPGDVLLLWPPGVRHAAQIPAGPAVGAVPAPPRPPSRPRLWLGEIFTHVRHPHFLLSSVEYSNVQSESYLVQWGGGRDKIRTAQWFNFTAGSKLRCQIQEWDQKNWTQLSQSPLLWPLSV